MIKDELKHLLKLQELEIVLEESQIVHGENHDQDTAKIETKITNLRKKISVKTLSTYDRLRKKGLGIAREVELRCKSCHMPMALSVVNAMKDSVNAPQCPNCNVIIFPSAFED